MASYDYDLIVVGSGMGGSIAAQQVAEAGKRVALIEAAQFGGTEANIGRVPIGSLHNTARIYEEVKSSSHFGIRGASIGYNYPTVSAWKDTVVKRARLHTGEEDFVKKGINYVHGRAYFIDSHVISIGSVRFSSAKFLIASGSDDVLSQIPGLAEAGFLTPREALKHARPFRNLAIIGGGAQACELAQLFSIFGAKVHLVQEAPRLLPNEDPEVSEFVTQRFKTQYGIAVALGKTPRLVEPSRAGKRITLSGGNRTQTILADEVLVATERKAATDIGLDNAGVSYHKGAIYTNNYMQTSQEHIYAAGSCTGSGSTNHVAAYQSQVVAHNIIHSKKPIRMSYHAIPRVVYLNPEVAIVGPTEAELEKSGTKYKQVKVPISVIARANIADSPEGFVKIIAHKQTNVVLGGIVVCPSASEVISELTVAVQNHLTTQQILHTLHPFSTWSEAIRVACAQLAKI